MFGILFWMSVVILLYVYLGYPLLIAVLAQGRKKQVFRSDFQPFVTLLFAAHNEEKVIVKKLANTLALKYPRERLQVIVADDGSTDGTAEIVRSYRDQGIDLVSFDERRGKLAALKDTVKDVHGEIILFSDADNLFNSFQAISRAISHPMVSSIFFSIFIHFRIPIIIQKIELSL